MATRTTIVLDEEARVAARELAQRFNCSASEAIRQAVVRQRDALMGVPASRRAERVGLLGVLFEQFEGHDPGEEVRRLKEEDDGF